MSGPDPEKVQKMHRYFAVECNNRAWELAELAVRSEEEDHELRINAHAAAYHWAKVGTPVNDMRARILLAEVAAQHGNGELALQLAGQGCAFFENEEGTEWDRAIGTLELAYAHAVSGSKNEVASLLEKAVSRGEQLAEKGDREYFAESHRRIVTRITALQK